MQFAAHAERSWGAMRRRAYRFNRRYCLAEMLPRLVRAVVLWQALLEAGSGRRDQLSRLRNRRAASATAATPMPAGCGVMPYSPGSAGQTRCRTSTILTARPTQPSGRAGFRNTTAVIKTPFTYRLQSLVHGALAAITGNARIHAGIAKSRHTAILPSQCHARLTSVLIGLVNLRNRIPAFQLLLVHG